MATAKRTGPTGKVAAKAQAALEEAVNPDQPVFPYPHNLHEDYRDIWRDTVNTKTGDYWSKGDIPILTMYCRCAFDVDRLTAQIRRDGETILNAKGNRVVNPDLVVRGFAESRVLSLATKLRLQPSSRMDTKGDANQGARKGKAVAAAKTVESDGDGLLAGAEGGLRRPHLPPSSLN